jgi:hypothetical protein
MQTVVGFILGFALATFLWWVGGYDMVPFHRGIGEALWVLSSMTMGFWGAWFSDQFFIDEE